LCRWPITTSQYLVPGETLCSRRQEGSSRSSVSS
jgi:hypothetical protein